MKASFSLNFMRSAVLRLRPARLRRLLRSLGWTRKMAAQSLPDFPRALAIAAVCTAIAWPLPAEFGLVNIVMIYLLGTTLGALRLGRGACVALAFCNMLAFDYFFVPPVFRSSIEAIGNIKVGYQTSSGANSYIPLRELAAISLDTGPAYIYPVQFSA